VAWGGEEAAHADHAAPRGTVADALGVMIARGFVATIPR